MLNILNNVRKHFMEIDVAYLRKWLLVGGLIGVVAGLGSIVFYSAITWATNLFLGQGAGFYPPLSVGEGAPVVTEISRRWMIPVITTVGGLISGLIVYKLAPEAEGHGTDAAIEAFHQKEGLIRARIPLVKLVASAITIGSGGSAGREGPTAQIAAGFGSLLARLLKLSVRDRRIAVAAGIGAGIGAIFKAPLGGALLSIEVLYLEGFEIDALIPSFLASIIGYTIFASWSGYTPVFGTHYDITSQGGYSLLYYAALGLVCGLIGILYPRCFYGVRDLFRKIKIPNYYKPAIGGLVVGLMGLALPQVLGMGYGWLQIAMEPQTVLPVGLMILLIFAKIVATSFSIGSGGSGGVFAPGLFIGGLIGAVMWTLLSGVAPGLPSTPEPFVVVGMMALFGGVARAPLAVMFMVGEMAGSYTMLAPAMIAVGASYIIVGRHTIYESQVKSPADSPAHRFDYSFPLLQEVKVGDAMNTKVTTIEPEIKAAAALEMLQTGHLKSLPVVNQNGGTHIVGIITVRDILRMAAGTRTETQVDDVMTRELITIHPEQSLDEALELMTNNDIASLPVVNGDETGLLGMLTRGDITRAYASKARKALN
jgi:CIC family chloride channel protein